MLGAAAVMLGAAAVMLGAPSNTQIMLMERLGLALLDMLLNVLAAQTLPLLESVSGHEVNFDSCCFLIIFWSMIYIYIYIYIYMKLKLAPGLR